MIRVQSEDFDVGDEIAHFTLGRTDIGAIATFLGLVRDGVSCDTPKSSRITAMTLEHYPGMTERQLADIEAEARNRWSLEDCLIIHRYGRLMPGERIVLVATAASHRAAALESCAFLIDWLKTKAPFWKLEETATGNQWVEAKHQDIAAAEQWNKVPANG